MARSNREDLKTNLEADDELRELVDGSSGSVDETLRDLDEPDYDDDTIEEPEFFFDIDQTSAMDPGIYHARCQRFSQGISSNGNRQFEVKVYLPEAKRSLDTQLSQTAAAAPITADNLRAMGVRTKNFKASDVEGLTFRVRVINEPWEGTDRPKIKGFLPKDEHTDALFASLDSE